VSEGAAKKEEKPRKFQAVRGTRDLFPPETELWNRVERAAHEVFATFGFGEIRLPIFEPTELFARSIGEETDVVSKEMYTFVDRTEKLGPEPKIGAFGIFIEKVRELYRSGEIPQTGGNQLALEHMESAWKKFNGLSPDVAISLEDLDNAYQMTAYMDAMRLGIEISLRPEATASVCRAYVEHGMQALPQPVKLYYMGPMFRRERPQKGRYRQFYQIGAEVLEKEVASGEWPLEARGKRVASKEGKEVTSGPPQAGVASKELAKDAAVDAEVIEMVIAFFDRLELQGVQLDINSIGDRNCRPKYIELLRAELLKVKDKLGLDSQRRIETNPLRVLDSKLESEQGIIATLPRIGDHLCEECATHYAAVKHQLEMRGVIYRENWRLVRGLDYYMRTTFEITAKGLGSQNAVCGGGRYDGLVELLGGPPTKGIGFAIGEDRLILSLQESGKGVVATGRDVYIAWMGERAHATAIRAAKDLRKAGFSVELPPVEQKFGKALGQADKLGAKYALILGDNEVSEGLWTLKTLADGSQAKYTEPDLLEHLSKQRALKL